MIDIFRLHAKIDPYVSLVEHCRDTGEVAGILWDIGIIDKSAIKREGLCLLAALHDLGKCHPVFQKKGLGRVDYIDLLMKEHLLPLADNQYRHELGTEMALLDRKERFAYNDIAEAVAKILRLHHQKSNSFIPISPNRQLWIKAQNALINELEKHFKITLKDIDFKISDSNCVLIWGTVILADWLVSGGLSEKVSDIFNKKALKPKPMEQMFDILRLRPLQQECQNLASYIKDNKPRLIIIEAPMGEGKTEAALYLAANLIDIYEKNGFFIALPTMATARQMEIRVSKYLTQNDVGSALLVHSQAWMDFDITKYEEIDKSWFIPAKRSLLANYGVGTVDQAMMSVLRIKHGVLRLLGLSGKILVIDEVHAYDTYMQTIIYRLLNWCVVLDIPVIMLSATLPKERKKQLIEACGCGGKITSEAYPLITIAKKDGLYEHAVDGSYIKRDLLWENIVFTDYKDIAYNALNAVKGGGCACVIMNTVKDAQQVFKAARDLVAGSDTELMLFHSRFLLKDRKIIEDKILDKFGKKSSARPQKAILFATQVVEQSLDVDFDYMISALAPIDLLLQRSGRIHRHERERPKLLNKPRLTVIINGDETRDSGIGRIYDEWILKQTQRTIQKIEESVNIPQDIRRLIEEVYGTVPDANDNDFACWVKKKSVEALDQGLAQDVVFPRPRQDLFFPLETGDFFDETDSQLVSSDAFTRLSASNIKVAVLPNSVWDEGKLSDCDADYAKKVLDFTVSIFAPRGCPLAQNGNLFKCGGYLKGVYAVKGENNFCVEYVNNIIKKYSIDAVYGLKEEK